MAKVDSLRQVLRTETAPSHARVDALISQNDLTCPDGMAAFLAIHHLAYTALAGPLRAAEGAGGPPLPLEDIEADLAMLGRTPLRWRTLPALDLRHPAGLIYVVAGSRLGATVLRARWQESRNQDVLRASRFLDSMMDRSHWTRFLRQAADPSIRKTDFPDIVETAKGCFSVFEAACRHVTRETAYGPP